MSERFVPKVTGLSEEVLIDENLPPLERVIKYSESAHPVQRLYLVRDIVGHAKSIGYKDSSLHIVPALDALLYDTEINIRLAISENLAPFCVYLLEAGGPEASDVVFEQIIPILYQTLKDRACQVREAAVSSLISIAQDIDQKQLIDQVLPLITKLAEELYEEDSRAMAPLLLNKLAPIMGASLTRSHTLPLLHKFTSDEIFRVRVAFVTTMTSLFDVIGVNDTTNILLPIYLEMSNDHIWTVRKACASILPEISLGITCEKRSKELAPLFTRFAKDNSRWVRTTAFGVLGQFIATFPAPMPTDTVHNNLLKYFCNMAQVNPEIDFADSESHLFCAFNFPAVLVTIGSERWPELEETYKQLSENLQWKVRRSLAFSLHVIGDILGQKISENILLPIFESFLKDLDEVKVGVIKNLSLFLKLLSVEKRKNYTFIVDEIQNTSTINWRFRKLIGKQIGSLSQIYDVQTGYSHIVPNVYHLLRDPVAQVRKATLPEVSKVLTSLSLDPEKKKEFGEKINAFSQHESYQYRVMFAKICAVSVGSVDKELFENIFLCSLLQLTSDKVPNTRIATAKAFLEILKNENYKKDERILQALETLKTDTDPDVVHTSGGIPPKRIPKQ